MKIALVVLVLCLIAIGIAARCKLGIHNLPDPNDAWHAGWATRATEAQCLRCGQWFILGNSAWMPSTAHVAERDRIIQEWGERKESEAAKRVEIWLNRGGQKRVAEDAG